MGVVRTLAQLLPWILAGAFLPTWTSYVILLLGTERPLSTSSAYVMGNATWRLILGLSAVFIVSVAAPQTRTRGIDLPPWVAWLFAAMMIGLGLWLVMRSPTAKSAHPGSLPRWLKAFRRLPPWAAFGYAVYNCAMPGAQWVYFLGGTAVIASSGFAWEWQILLLAAFVALLEVMLVTPIVIYYRRREDAKATFDRIERWLGRHAATVIGGVLVTIGGLFVWIALNGGRIGGTG